MSVIFGLWFLEKSKSVMKAEEVCRVRCTNRYYEGGISSVYFWNLDDGFAGVVLLKKSMAPAQSPNLSMREICDVIH